MTTVRTLARSALFVATVFLFGEIALSAIRARHDDSLAGRACVVPPPE